MIKAQVLPRPVEKFVLFLINMHYWEIAQRWFYLYRSGNFDMKDVARGGLPITEKIGQLIVELEQDRHMSSHNIAKELSIYYGIGSDSLK